MDIDLIRGILTALLFVLFCGLCIFNYSGQRQADHAAAARLPLENDEDLKDEHA